MDTNLAKLIVGCYSNDWEPVHDMCLDLGEEKIAAKLSKSRIIPFSLFNDAYSQVCMDKYNYWKSLSIEKFLSKIDEININDFIWLNENRKRELDRPKIAALNYKFHKNEQVLFYVGPYYNRQARLMRYHEMLLVAKHFKLKSAIKVLKSIISNTKDNI